MQELTDVYPWRRRPHIPDDAWDQAPWNRWSFLHMRELFATVAVANKPNTIWHLASYELPLDAIILSDHQQQQLTVSDWLSSSYTDGFIVMHRGRICFERYFNNMTAASLHLSQSVAKSVTATLAGILCDQKLLCPSDPVTRYLPELHTTAWSGATIRHVMDMTSGVLYDEDYLSPDSDIAMTDIACGWRSAAGRTSAPRSVWQQILGLDQRSHEHGERFLYRSIETDVLAHCIERICGCRWEEALSSLLWSAMGAEADGYFTVDRNGYALADGGFNATLRDYARFGQLLCNRGAANDRRIVSAQFVDDIIESGGVSLGADYQYEYPNGGYRSQFWVPDRQATAFMALGVFGQCIYIDPAREMVCVKLSSWPEYLSPKRELDALNAYNAISNYLNPSDAIV